MVYNCSIDPVYFLDKMQMDEVVILMKKYNEDYQNKWEQTRFISYITACSMGAKLKKPTDLIRFGWEETTTKAAKPAQFDIDKMRAEMVKSLENYKSGNITDFKHGKD